MKNPDHNMGLAASISMQSGGSQEMAPLDGQYLPYENPFFFWCPDMTLNALWHDQMINTVQKLDAT